MKPFRRARHSWHVGDQKPEADSNQQQLQKLKTVYEERESTPLVLPSLHLNPQAPASPRSPKSKQLWRKTATVVSTARVGGTKALSPPPEEAPARRFVRKSVQVPQYGWLKQLEKKQMEQSDAIPAGWFGDVKGPVRDSADIAQMQYIKSGAKTSRKWVESEISGILGDIRSYDECTKTDRSRRKSVDMRLPPCRNIRSFELNFWELDGLIHKRKARSRKKKPKTPELSCLQGWESKKEGVVPSEWEKNKMSAEGWSYKQYKRQYKKKDVGVLMRTRSMRVCPPIPEPIEKEELQQIHEVRQMKEVLMGVKESYGSRPLLKARVKLLMTRWTVWH